MCSCTHPPITNNHSGSIHIHLCRYKTRLVILIPFSMLSSQGLVLATAMAVSAGTIILFKDKYFSNIHQNPPEKKALKSCLVSNSGSKKNEGKKKKKKKRRVKFAEDVKDSDKNIVNGELYRKLGEIQKSCGDEVIGIHKMPANHVALYSGILRDRGHRMQYSC